MNYEHKSLISNYVSAEADWGIEETSHQHKRFDSVSTSDFSQPPKIREYGTQKPLPYNRSSSFGVGSDTYTTGITGSEDFSKGGKSEHGREYAPEKVFSLDIIPSTENFRKFIAKYLSLEPPRALVVEKFKYNLVLSNLLDESLVLSKNDQALKNLLKMRQSEDRYLAGFLKRKLNDDGIVLKVVNKKYLLLLPTALQNPLVHIQTINLIIFLLKKRRNLQSRLKYSSQIKLFKILLIISTRILKSKRAQATIESSRSLRSLDDFMISNCNINKVIIGHMITLKEFDLFTFLNKNPAHDSSSLYSKTLKKHLDTLLHCLILNMKYSIRELLPFSNGDLLEKYCQINNVKVSAIYETSETTPDDALSLELLTSKLTLFNNHRRFFVCQLLTIHDYQLRNFFILTLCDHLNIDLASYLSFHTSSFKVTKLNELFTTHTATVDQLFGLNEKFKVLHTSSPSADYANDDILSAQKVNVNGKSMDEVFKADSELDLSNLIDKLLGIVTSLKYFKKYSELIANLDNAEEHEERISIFGLFQSELSTCLEMFAACMGEYKSDFLTKFHFSTSNPSSCSNSQRNSQRSENPFNLKAFHNLNTKEKNKYPVILPHDSQTSLERHDKKSKRMSTGLQLGLLTVLEDPRQATIDLRGLPMNTSTHHASHGSYNQAALEALTKKMNNLGNRFSMASATSNVSGFSDLIASTQITTDEDDGENPKTEFMPEGSTQGMSKADLEKKLEESFMRIYNLESENHELKSKSPASETTEEPICHDAPEPLFSAAKDRSFLRSLEKSLSAKSPASDIA